MAAGGERRVVYVESHDEAGAHATRRTIVVAADGAPLVGDRRRVAEARCRCAAGMTLLSAGTPMFLMGEEVGSQDLVALRLASAGLRSRLIDVLQVDDGARVLAFPRWDDTGKDLVVGSLAERPYDAPDHGLAHPALAEWGGRERFDGDAGPYGGSDVGDHDQILRAEADGRLRIVVPALGFVVLERVPAGG